MHLKHDASPEDSGLIVYPEARIKTLGKLLIATQLLLIAMHRSHLTAC